MYQDHVPLHTKPDPGLVGHLIEGLWPPSRKADRDRFLGATCRLALRFVCGLLWPVAMLAAIGVRRSLRPKGTSSERGVFRPVRKRDVVVFHAGLYIGAGLLAFQDTSSGSQVFAVLLFCYWVLFIFVTFGTLVWGIGLVECRFLGGRILLGLSLVRDLW